MSALIKIQKNNAVKTVSMAAYKNYYEDFGWGIVEGKEPSTSPISEVEEVKEEVTAEVEENTVETEETNSNEEEVADEEWDEAIAEEEVEKPISEMNREELIAKAETLGLSVRNESNKKIREMIKEVM